jgi:alpha-N-acetylglucosaminidase
MSKDIRRADELYNNIEKLSSDLDTKISARGTNSLDHWLKSAWNYGDSKETSKLYLKNAKMIITMWGGNDHLNDYASRAWHGMYKEFYWPRWKMFLRALRESSISNKPFDELKERGLIKDWEEKWCNALEF